MEYLWGTTQSARIPVAYLSLYAGGQSPFSFEKGYSCFLCSFYINPGQMKFSGIFQRSVKPRPRCKPGGDQIRFLHKGAFHQLMIVFKIPAQDRFFPLVVLLFQLTNSVRLGQQQQILWKNASSKRRIIAFMLEFCATSILGCIL